MSVTIGALRESAPRETRVCLVPEVADKLTREGARILIERGAGVRACFPDSLYKGVSWADPAAVVLATADGSVPRTDAAGLRCPICTPGSGCTVVVPSSVGAQAAAKMAHVTPIEVGGRR